MGKVEARKAQDGYATAPKSSAAKKKILVV